MKKSALVVAFTLFVPALLRSQDTYPRAEIFGGYSFLHTDAPLRKDNIPKGWIGSFAYNLRRNIGIEAAFSGHYGHSGPVVPFDDSNYLFQFGPRFALRLPRLTPWAHVLLGASRSKVRGAVTSKTNFAWALGGGLDVPINKNVSLRVVEADYVRMKIAALTASSGNGFGLITGPVPSNNLRLSFGLVFAFGGNY